MDLKKIFLRRNTMLTRVLVPTIIVFIVQAVVIIAIFINAGIFQKSISQSYEYLNAKVKNRKVYINNERINRWTNISTANDSILTEIKNQIKTAHIDFIQLNDNPIVVNNILRNIFPSMLYTLRNNSVTGVFFVLNSPLQNNSSGDSLYPGLYIRDDDPRFYSNNNEDVLISKGLAQVGEDYNIALDATWTNYFSIGNDITVPEDKFFHAPIFAAENSTPIDSKYLCYWSRPFRFKGFDEDVITYSIPVIANDGTIYGILGIDLSINYFKSYLGFENLIDMEKEKDLYCIALVNESQNKSIITPFIVNNTDSKTKIDACINCEAKKTDNANIIIIENKSLFEDNQIGSVQYLELYPRNSIYENEDWALIGLVSEKELLSSYFVLKKVFIHALSIGAVLFFFATFIYSKRISNTLTKVVVKLEHNDNTKPIEIEKVNIQEIDTLIYAIENLSIRIFNAASRVSKIIEQAEVPIGVFEQNNVSGTVFCNSILFKLFNIEKYNQDVTLDYTEFYEVTKFIKNYVHSKQNGKILYAVPTGEPGKIRWIEFSIVKENERILGVATDITQATEEKNRLEVQMTYDELTGLFNRAVFEHKITDIFKNSTVGICALIMWDIDNLKFLNVSFGHSYGDAYLRMFAKKLATLQQEKCIVGRRTGDEFYTLFYNYSSKDEINKLLNDFWVELENTKITLPDGKDTKLRVSGGIAWYPDNADNIEDLLRYADFASYNVKHSFKGSLQEFDIDSYKENYILIKGTEAFNRMIENQLIKYVMQPIVKAGNGEIYGYEMLMRPNISDFKSPEDILRLARTQAKLHKIEEISFFLAMEAFTKKIESGEIPSTTKVFLNTISSQILSGAKFEEFENRFRPYLGNIVLEIAENEPLNSAIYTIKSEKIEQWNGMIAIDDFGSGYSNDAALVFLAPNIVKIDMLIVRDIHKNPDKQSILENLVSYAKKRDIIVLAEGVECEEEIKILLRFGVDLFQGYFFAKPSTEIKPIPQERLSVLA